MTDEPKPEANQGQGAREPILNLPGAVLALCAAMVVIGFYVRRRRDSAAATR